MNIILRDNETMKDLVDRLSASFELVYDIAPVAFWYENLNENGRIRDIHFSKRMRDMLGYGSEEEFPDDLNTLMTFTHPDDIHIMLDDAIRAGTGEIEKYDVQYRIRKADGTYMWCNATGELVKDSNGTTVGMYGAFIDVTEEVELRRSQEEKKRSEALINNFARDNEAAFLGNITDGSYRVIVINDDIREYFTGNEPFPAALMNYLNNMVNPDDSKVILGELNNIRNANDFFGIGKSMSFEYRRKKGEELYWYRITINRISEEEILIGLVNCDEEHTFKLVNKKLMDEFDSIYIVSLYRNRIRPVRPSRISAAGQFFDAREYSSAVLQFADYVDPKYKDICIKFSDPEFVRNYMANDDHREYVFELPGTEKSMRRISIDVASRTPDGVVQSVLLTSAGIDDARAQTIRLNRQLAEQAVELEDALEQVNMEVKRRDMLYDIIGSGKWIYEIKGDEVVKSEYSDIVASRMEQKHISDPMGWVNAVHPEDRERVYNAFMAPILDHSGNTTYNEAFRIFDREGKLQWARSAGRVIRREDGTAEYIGLTTNTTKQVEEQQKRMADRLEIEQLRMKEQQLMHSEFRSSVVAYLAENEGNITSFLKFFADKFRELLKCDQIVYRDESGNRFVSDDPELGGKPLLFGEVCRRCPHFDVHSPIYVNGVAEMEDTRTGVDGNPMPYECPVKSALTRTVSLEGETIGYLAIHYIREKHKFTDYERTTLEEFANLLSVTLSRNAAKTRSEQLEQELEQEKAAEHELLAQNYLRILALEDDFEALYDVELESGHYESFVKGDFYQRNINDKLVSQTSFFDDLKINIDHVIYKDDRESVHAIQTREGMITNLEHMDHYDQYYRAITEEGPMWLKMRISYKDADKRNVIIGVFNAEEEVAAKEKEAAQLKKTETKLRHERLRAEVLNYMVNNYDDDPIDLLKRFADRIRRLIDCDQVIYRDLKETRIMVNSPEIEDTWSVPLEFCQQCEHFDAHHPMYAGGYTEMDDCQKGWNGIPVYHECPIKSSLTRIVYCDGEIAGYFAIHYVREHHHFTTIERRTLEEFGRILSMSLSRYNAREESKEKKRFDILHEIINSSQWSFFINEDDEVVGAEFSEGMRRIVNNDLNESPLDWIKAVHPDEQEMVRTKFQAAIEDHTGNSPYDAVFRMADRDGNYNWFHSAGRVTRDKDGTGEFFGIHINITEQIENERQQQRKLEEALDMAESANRAKTTFLNSMSHDIRTPMNAIIGYTGLAADHIEDTRKVKDYLGKISQSSDHLLSLINDVLDMSRIESGKINLDEKNENLSEIIHNLRDIVQVDIHAKNLDFRVDAVDIYDEDIVCDKLRLNQVLLNILSNAIKYTDEGGKISMRIAEKTVKLEGTAAFEFRVSDNGMGMEKEFLDTIFEPFTRVKSSTVSGIQGTGLGMTITKTIIDMMGGEINIESEPGKGTEVTILFNFKLQNDPPVLRNFPEYLGTKALIADDAVTCASIGSILSEVGMKYECCSLGQDAVVMTEDAKLTGDPYRVAVIDWNLPDMNGIDTVREIRKHCGDDISIILLTAYDWSEIEDEAREAGVDAFVAKPMFPSDLNRAFHTCITKNGAPEEKPSKEYDFTGRKILLVEDNELNLEIATDILTDCGFELDTAVDGYIAIDKMKSANTGDYDLILMDVQMPVIDGYEATRQIRALGTGISKIPIIALTANAFEEDRKLAIESGMNDHISKPLNVEKLKATLAKYL